MAGVAYRRIALDMGESRYMEMGEIFWRYDTIQYNTSWEYRRGKGRERKGKFFHISGYRYRYRYPIEAWS